MPLRANDLLYMWYVVEPMFQTHQDCSDYCSTSAATAKSGKSGIRGPCKSVTKAMREINSFQDIQKLSISHLDNPDARQVGLEPYWFFCSPLKPKTYVFWYPNLKVGLSTVNQGFHMEFPSCIWESSAARWISRFIFVPARRWTRRRWWTDYDWCHPKADVILNLWTFQWRQTNQSAILPKAHWLSRFCWTERLRKHVQRYPDFISKDLPVCDYAGWRYWSFLTSTISSVIRFPMTIYV